MICSGNKYEFLIDMLHNNNAWALRPIEAYQLTADLISACSLTESKNYTASKGGYLASMSSPQAVVGYLNQENSYS